MFWHSARRVEHTNRWIVEFMAQAFIAPIDDLHGFENWPVGRGFAWFTDLGFSENPFSPDSTACRLKTHGKLECEVDPATGRFAATPRLRITQSGGVELAIIKGKIGFVNGTQKYCATWGRTDIAVVPKEAGSERCSWSFVVHGRPNCLLSWTFAAGGFRLCSHIWHRVTLAIAVQNDGTVEFKVDLPDSSDFPSHRLWGMTPANPDGRELFTKQQKEFNRLWFHAPPPDDLDTKFVKASE